MTSSAGEQRQVCGSQKSCGLAVCLHFLHLTGPPPLMRERQCQERADMRGPGVGLCAPGCCCSARTRCAGFRSCAHALSQLVCLLPAEKEEVQKVPVCILF